MINYLFIYLFISWLLIIFTKVVTHRFTFLSPHYFESHEIPTTVSQWTVWRVKTLSILLWMSYADVYTWRSTLTILEARLILESYTSAFFDPTRPSIWSNLQHTTKRQCSYSCWDVLLMLLLVIHGHNKEEKPTKSSWPALQWSDPGQHVEVAGWVLLDDVLDIVRF